VSDRPDVDVRLLTLEFLLGHALAPYTAFAAAFPALRRAFSA